MQPFLVSIIIPVYNAEKYLEATLRSAIAQTWEHKEIILVDDGSADNSLMIAKSYECSFIKVYNQPNSGASAARNKGLSEAKGDFIQFLDADDLLSADKISRQLSLIGDQKDTLAICPVVHFNNDQEHQLNTLSPNAYELQFYIDSDNPFEFLLNLYGIHKNGGSMIPIHSWLTQASLIKKAGLWNEELSLNDDGEFFCRMAANATAILNTPDTFCYYRKISAGNSLSSHRDYQAFTSQFMSIKLIQKHLETCAHDPRIAVVVSRLLMDLLIKVYPQHKELALGIERSVKEAGGSPHRPVIGGKAIELIKHMFGWKCARILQYYYQNLAPQKH
ncbi:glycosyltransferase family 2 protein [Pedobacter sp. WC2423]|uniref:glycosyltransferase family 2 protein n=1 Tax=Pedobacter sp. WC2423 TaxID=3234142 RepID=UPI0034673480